MTEPDDLAEKLRSLSIDRDTEPARRRRLGLPVLLLATVGIVSGTGYALSVNGIDLSTDAIGKIVRFESASDTANLRPDENMQAKLDEPASSGNVTPKPRQPAPKASVIGTGYVVAPATVSIKTQIPGKIAELFVDVGDRVKQGQELATLDPTAAQLGLAIAKSDLALAAARKELAEVTLKAAQEPLERLRILVAKGAASSAKLKDEKLEVARLRQAVNVELKAMETSRLRIAEAEITLERHVLRAPFDAIVTARPAAPGLIVSSGEEGGADKAGLMTLMNTQSVLVDVDVAERNISEVEHGQTAVITLDAFPHRQLKATVLLIEPSASRQKGTVNVRLQIDGEDTHGVLANMAAKVMFLDQAPLAVSGLNPNEKG